MPGRASTAPAPDGGGEAGDDGEAGADAAGGGEGDATVGIGGPQPAMVKTPARITAVAAANLVGLTRARGA